MRIIILIGVVVIWKRAMNALTKAGVVTGVQMAQVSTRANVYHIMDKEAQCLEDAIRAIIIHGAVRTI